MILELAILISIVANFGASAIEPASERGSFCEGVLASTAGLGDEQIQQIFEIVIEKLPPEDLQALKENPLQPKAFSAPDLRLNEGRTLAALLAKMESEGQLASDRRKNKWKKIFSKKIERKISEIGATSKKIKEEFNRHRDSSDLLFHIGEEAWGAGLVANSKKLAVLTSEHKKYQLWDLQTKTRLIEVPNPYGNALLWTASGMSFFYSLNSGTGVFSNGDLGRIGDSRDRIQTSNLGAISRPRCESCFVKAFHRKPWLAVFTQEEEQNFLEIWDPYKGTQIQKKLISNTRHSPYLLSISESDEHIALSFSTGGSWYWNRKSNQTFSLSTTSRAEPKFSPDDQFIIFDTDGRQLLSKVFRLSSKHKPTEIESLTGTRFRFLPGNKLIYVDPNLRSLNIRDLQVGSSTETSIPLPNSVGLKRIYFSPNGRFYCVCDFTNGILMLFHIKNNLSSETIFQFTAIIGKPRVIKFLTDVPALFLVLYTGEVRQIDLSPWEETP